MIRAVLVKSCRRFNDRRAACAHTWVGHLRREGYQVKIFEGGHDHSSYDTNSIFSTCDDRVQHGITFNGVKLQVALRTMLRSTKFDYLFIADDDTFVHPLRWIAHDPAGYIECRVFRPVTSRDIKRRGSEPWIHGGAGWYMSRTACEMYVESTVSKKMGDDVAVARLMQSYNISMIDKPRFYGSDKYSGRQDEVKASNSLITCHHVTPKRMRELYRELIG